MNDNPPIFHPPDKITLSIKENNQVGDVITIINATDADCPKTGNGLIKFSMGDRFLSIIGQNGGYGNGQYYSAQPSNYFQLDSDTGKLKAKVKFDREEHQQFSFLVHAEDQPGI